MMHAHSFISFVTYLQKHVRARLAKQQLISLREENQAAIVLQCLWRQRLAQQQCATQIRRQQAATTIQNFWRLAQFKDVIKNEAAIQIQRAFRGYWSRIQYIIDVLDIVAVQSCARRLFAKRERARVVGALGALQRACRSYFARKKLAERRQMALRTASAVRIQSVFRRLQAKKVAQFEREQVFSATTIQSVWRRRLAQAIYIAVKFSKAQQLAAITLQSAWRRWKAQLLLAKLKWIKKRALAAFAIQSCYRMARARKVLDDRKQAHCREVAAICIQSSRRGYRTRLELRLMHFAATRIQASIRRWTQQRLFVLARLSAITIQVHWKTFIYAKEFKALVNDFRICQSVVRMWLAKVECQRRRTSIVLLQNFSRQWLARRKVEELRDEHARREIASIIMQRYWRGFCTFVKFRLVVQDATVIQSSFRRFLARKISRDRSQAVLRVQQAVRSAIARQRRRDLVAKKRAEEQARWYSAVRIQTLYRGYLVRREYQYLNCCALLIQSMFRGHIARIDYSLDIVDIVTVQCTVRRWLAKRRVWRRQDRILTLQCFLRCSLARIYLLKLVAAKQRADLEQDSTTTIQRVFRAFVARRLVLQESSARKIQKTWRCYTIHVEYMLSILAAIEIQASIRRYLSILHFDHKYFAVIRLQAFARLALHKLQRWREEDCAIVVLSNDKKIPNMRYKDKAK